MIKKFAGGSKDFGKRPGKGKDGDSGFGGPRRPASPSKPAGPEKREDSGKKTYKSRPDKRNRVSEEEKDPKKSGYRPKEGKFSPEKKPVYKGKPGVYPSKDKKLAAGKTAAEGTETRPPQARKVIRPTAPSNEKKVFASKVVKVKKDWDKDDRAQREAVEDDRLIMKGRHEVVQALESGQTIDSVVISTAVKGPVGKIVRELAGKSQIPVKEMSPDLFERKFGEKSQGIVAIGGSFVYCSLEEIAAKATAARGVLVALNHVEDARNLGAIVRTVEASGCSGVLLPKHRSAGMSEWAIRTAQGAAAYLPVARVNNIGDALEQLKTLGFWVVGLDGDAEKRYDQVVYSGNLVLVAGGEDAGLGERVRKVCDDVVAIPLSGKTPSLNVSVSTAVVLYEIIRQKQFFQKN